MDGGWLTTKKRGRDDVQIARDKENASMQRRNKKTTTTKKRNNKNKATKTSTKKRARTTKRQKKGSDYDDDDSINDFIVDEDDDDEDEEEFASDDLPDDDDDDDNNVIEVNDNDDHELDELISSNKKKKKKNDKDNNEKDDIIDVDNDDDSDDDDDDLLDIFSTGKNNNVFQKKRTSRPSAALAAASKQLEKSRARSQHQQPALLMGTKMKKPPSLSLVQSAASKASSSRKTKKGGSPSANSSTSGKTHTKDEEKKSSSRKKSMLLVEENDTGSDGDEQEGRTISNSRSYLGDCNSKKEATTAVSSLQDTPTPRKSTSTTTLDLNDDDDDDHLFNKGSNNETTTSNKSKSWKSWLYDDDDGPVKKKTKKKNGDNNNDGYRRIRKQSEQQQQRNGNKNQKKSTSIKAGAASAGSSSSDGVLLYDSCDNEDEAIAVAWAIRESTKEANNDKKNKNDRNNSGKNPSSAGDDDDDDDSAAPNNKKALDELLAEESSEDDDDDDRNDNDDDVDDYEDPEAREASIVLQTANKLSARVIKVMTSWSSSTSTTTTSKNGDNNNNNNVPMGMIVDGALSLSTIAVNTTTSDAATMSTADHSWISMDTMKKVLPKVTLADYQLIGVNWLALLHGMKCVMKGATSNKKNGGGSYANVNGILADEMGLGKTMQTIAFLSWLKYQRRNKQNSSGEVVIDVDSNNEEKATHQSSSSSSSTPALPSLVVVPASVLPNWEREFERFSPDLKVVKFHGTQQERSQLKKQLSCYLPGGSNNKKRTRRRRDEDENDDNDDLDIILAPITYFQKEKSDDRSFLKKFKYEYLVVDEAHVLKNANVIRYKSLNKLTTMHRLLLTGTPVQNSPKELMALLCFLMPLFSAKCAGKKNQFEDDNDHDGGQNMLQHFVSLEGGDKNGSNGNIVDEATAYSKLKQLFAPYVLRRRKKDVLSQIMPPKTRQVEIVDMTNEARLLYDSIISDHIKAKEMKKKIKNGRSSTSSTATTVEHIFTNLRKASHHPLLLRSRYTTPKEKEHLAKHFHLCGAFGGEGCTREMVANELEKFSDFDIHVTALELVTENKHRHTELDRYILSENDLFCSCKFQRLRELLPQLIHEQGHRILIFSMWTSCLDLLSCLLESMNIQYLRMDGSTPVNERQILIDQFNNNNNSNQSSSSTTSNDNDEGKSSNSHTSTSIPVFLLSTTACGLGINLTSADICIMHDISFNPMNDEQAEDRCHRIGQTKPVKVIKLISKDTVDYDIYELQQRKTKMSIAIMGNSGDQDNNEDKKAFAKAKDEMLQSAVHRYLKSPTKQPKQLT